jgi:hypothetical protein
MCRIEGLELKEWIELLFPVLLIALYILKLIRKLCTKFAVKDRLRGKAT